MTPRLDFLILFVFPYACVASETRLVTGELSYLEFSSGISFFPYRQFSPSIFFVSLIDDRKMMTKNVDSGLWIQVQLST